MIEVAARLSWRTGRGILRLHKPGVMGILNITPDSFYDGGRHAGISAALHQTERMLSEGADIIDVGGESTRPGAGGVPASDELERVLPVVRAIVRCWPAALVSIDTVKSQVARAAADEGAAIINDVSGLRLDEGVADVVTAAGLGIVLMHSRGAVTELARYDNASYGDDPVADIVDEVGAAVEVARAHGIAGEQIVVDPGVGFSKRTEHSVAVIAQLPRFAALGYPLLVGPSRKRFVGELSGGLPPEQRLEGTLGALVAALARGATLFRVHDVQAARRALDVAHAILNGQ